MLIALKKKRQILNKNRSKEKMKLLQCISEKIYVLI